LDGSEVIRANAIRPGYSDADGPDSDIDLLVTSVDDFG